MPRKDPKGIVAGHRVAEARRIIADQHALIEKLRASKQATLDAERSLQVYASSLKHLEDHERRIRESKPQTESLAHRDRRRRRVVYEETFTAARFSKLM